MWGRYLWRKFTIGFMMVAMLAQGSYIVKNEYEMRAQRAATPVVQKLTSTMKLINGEAYVTLDGVSQYSYEQFRENLQLIKAHGITNMHLTMLNPGGSIYHMWGIYDMLQAAIADGLVLHTNAQGLIASAAVPLFLLGSVRTMQEHAYLMIHSHNLSQSDYKPESFNAMTAQWTEWYIALLLERTTMGEEEIRKYLDNDGDYTIQFWMNYDQAEARGFLTN